MADQVRIIEKLDFYLNKNDYASAERHLDYWLMQSRADGDARCELLVQNERMGLYRKLGRRDEAIACAEDALRLVEETNAQDTAGAATVAVNSATVYKAFGFPERSLELFERARSVYERELDASDARLAALYNNMALTLVDLRHFEEAQALYSLALETLARGETGSAEAAVTYLNMASAKEAEAGPIDAEETVTEYLETARRILDSDLPRDGNYAFVCEKCASVYGYYGYFIYEKELRERARAIYEGT